MVALGYVSRDKKLFIEEEEAERVRTIFQRYLELGSIGLLLADLRRRRSDGLPRRSSSVVALDSGELICAIIPSDVRLNLKAIASAAGARKAELSACMSLKPFDDASMRCRNRGPVKLVCWPSPASRAARAHWPTLERRAAAIAPSADQVIQ